MAARRRGPAGDAVGRGRRRGDRLRHPVPRTRSAGRGAGAAGRRRPRPTGTLAAAIAAAPVAAGFAVTFDPRPPGAPPPSCALHPLEPARRDGGGRDPAPLLGHRRRVQRRGAGAGRQGVGRHQRLARRRRRPAPAAGLRRTRRPDLPVAGPGRRPARRAAAAGPGSDGRWQPAAAPGRPRCCRSTPPVRPCSAFAAPAAPIRTSRRTTSWPAGVERRPVRRPGRVRRAPPPWACATSPPPRSIRASPASSCTPPSPTPCSAGRPAPRRRPRPPSTSRWPMPARSRRCCWCGAWARSTAAWRRSSSAAASGSPPAALFAVDGHGRLSRGRARSRSPSARSSPWARNWPPSAAAPMPSTGAATRPRS